MADEPKLTGMMVIGAMRFSSGVKFSTAQGAIDRLHAAYERRGEALRAIYAIRERLPDDLKAQIAAAIGMS